MNRNHLDCVRPSRPLALMLAAAVAVGCASGRRTTTTSGGDVDQPAATDTAGRVPPGEEGISPTGGQPPVLGPGVTTAPQPGSPAVATRDSVPGAGGAGAAGGAASTAAPRSDANIIALLHESNLGEIRAGTVAQQKAASAPVRSFAAQMITDHTALDQRGSAIASAERITPTLPDSSLPQQQQQELEALQRATGAAFDRAYLTQQVAAHQRTLALVDASIPMARAAALRTALQSEVRPRVAEHLRMAEQLQTQLGTAP